MPTRSASQSPLIVHLIHRLDVGGLENGLINVINRLPADRYRHAIICLKGSSAFSERLSDSTVGVFDLKQKNGYDPAWYLRLWHLLRTLKPLVFHSRNLPTLEGQIVAAAAGVPVRIHAEHGRDVHDLTGEVRRYRWLRRAVDPLVHQYVAVSTDLHAWLVNTVGLRAPKIRLIPNGVDVTQFRPGHVDRGAWCRNFCDETHIVIGTVGRMAAVKDQPTLVKAFCRLIEREPEWRQRIRLVAVGDGSLRDACLKILQAAEATELAWLPGNRTDVAALMRGFDIFVLPSRAEGMSNTILEAMATALPVVATAVGGNCELVQDGVTGRLVPPSDEEALAEALRSYVARKDERVQHGRNGRHRIETEFAIDRMIADYQSLYDDLVSPISRSAETECAELRGSSRRARV